MKIFNLKEFYMIAIMLFSLQVFAGAEGRGGGDLCEDRIKLIGSDLKDWIINRGPDDLKLPSGISVEQYSNAMLDEIANVKIECVGQGDQGYPININGVSKVCRFDKDSNGSQITCDFIKFNATDESDQYVLIHHEYAGLAGLELPNGSNSDYTISNQISGYLQDQVVKKLVVKKAGHKQTVPAFIFVKIKADTFQMGSPVTEYGREKNEILHKVTLTKNFEMQTTEVTQQQWLDVMGTLPYEFEFRWEEYCPKDFIEINGLPLCPRNPIEMVSWNDVQLYIEELNKMQNVYTYRLPTEAEWEFAARGGAQTAYSFGDDPKDLGKYAWFDKNSSKQTHAVGLKRPNPYGLFDMYGNVSEWVQDFYGDYTTGAVTDPQGPLYGQVRANRGFSYSDQASDLRSATRSYSSQNHAHDAIGRGFRLVRTARYLQFGDIVKNPDGSIRRMVQSSEYFKSIGHPRPNGELGAVEYCASQGMRLPSIRELAELLVSMGAAGVSETVKTGSVYVSSKNADGSADGFYFTNTGYHAPNLDFARNKFWSSSLGSSFSSDVYFIDGSGGYMDAIYRDETYAVRCVVNN